MSSIIPEGVTKRHLDTLISRGSPISIGGTAVVCCMHGQEKRANASYYEHDPKDGHPHLCPCCQNWYSKMSDEPGFCIPCTPGRKLS